MNPPVYLDYNATTPVDPRVLEAMLPFFSKHFGNSGSRTHAYGWTAEEAVKIAREQVAALIGAETQEVIFTSGATESLNLSLKGVFQAYASHGGHIITVSTEHKAVLDTCGHLAKAGAEITYLPVDSDGLVSAADLEAAMRPETILVAVMLANNETGVIQPIAALSEIAHRHSALFLCDATQAVGKMHVDVNELHVDLLALSAHKLYGPKGVGALYVRRRNPRVRLEALIHGGGHERGLRSGTLNVPGIVGLGKACEISQLEMQESSARLADLRNQLEHALLQLPNTRLNGHPQKRLAHVSNISFGDVEAEALMMAMRGVAVSTGSACTSANLEPSHVLQAMGVSRDDAYAAIRFSLGRPTTAQEIAIAKAHITQAVLKLRGQNPKLQEH